MQRPYLLMLAFLHLLILLHGMRISGLICSISTFFTLHSCNSFPVCDSPVSGNIFWLYAFVITLITNWLFFNLFSLSFGFFFVRNLRVVTFWLPFVSVRPLCCSRTVTVFLCGFSTLWGGVSRAKISIRSYGSRSKVCSTFLISFLIALIFV